jgi:ribose transport system ATP-binding protein
VTEHSTVAVDRVTMVLSGISKSYAGVHALTDVSLEAQPGQIHALLGENGAGKSTLMAVASGSTRPDAGTIIFQDEPITHLTPALATQLGIAIVHQHPALLPDLTVAENLRVAVPAHFLRFAGDEETSMRRLLDGVGSSVHLNDRSARMPSTCSSTASGPRLGTGRPLSTSPTASQRSGSWPIGSPCCGTASCGGARRSATSPTTNCSP